MAFLPQAASTAFLLISWNIALSFEALKHIQRKLYREDKRCKDKKNTLVALEILYAENHGDFMDIIGFFMWVLITSENLKFFQVSSYNSAF